MFGVLSRRSVHVIVAAALVLLSAPAHARHHRKHKQPTPLAGAFDYYVLSLSWSPEHCAAGARHADDPQCATPRRYGFVLHGLWPQYESGYPQSCATGVSLSSTTVDSMLDVMPNPQLVRHEWSKHGTCSGLTPEAYFATARTAYTAVKIPAPYNAPPTAFQTSASDIEQAFRGANAGLEPSETAVLCAGKFLQEVRVCLDKNLHPRPCGRDVRDACKGSIIVRPIK